jgi:thiamine biosynthesis protein ThiI
MKGILLLSSGIDSPVAGYQMLSLGVDLVAIHFSNADPKNTFSIDLSKKMILQLSKETGRKIPLYIIKNYDNENLIWDNTNRRYQCLLCKRLMYRIAEAIAKKEGCDFLVTGENLGQVASQTIDNLAVLTDATSLQVMRPLLCNDKQDTVKIAEEIGTYPLSITQSVKKCPFLPTCPSTKARLEEVKYQESILDIDAMVQNSLKNAIRLEP